MIFARGLRQPETPRLLPDGSWLVVEMEPPGAVTRISQDGKKIERIAAVERPIGLAVDRENTIWVAATHPRPALVRVALDGTVTEFSTGPADGPFLHPNDLCFDSSAILYMTDSGILPGDWVKAGAVRPDYRTAPIDGKVFRIDTKTGRIDRLDGGLRFANGIAFGPDRLLYANEMITGNVFRYDPTPGGGARRTMVGNVLSRTHANTGFRGPDGMAFSREGDCYCAVFGQGDVTVLGWSGECVNRIATAGRYPTNVSFGPNDEKAIYVTEKEFGTVEYFAVDTHGAPVFH